MLESCVCQRVIYVSLLPFDLVYLKRNSARTLAPPLLTDGFENYLCELTRRLTAHVTL